jgi:hypothetical protein
MRSGPEAGNCDAFAFELFRRFDAGPDHQPIVKQFLNANQHLPCSRAGDISAPVICPKLSSPEINDPIEMFPGM